MFYYKQVFVFLDCCRKEFLWKTSKRCWTKNKSFYFALSFSASFGDEIVFFCVSPKEEKLFKYLLDRRINSQKKASQRDCVIIIINNRQQHTRNITWTSNDFHKYLRRFCVWLKWREEVKFKFYLTSSFFFYWMLLVETIEKFWPKKCLKVLK